MLLCRCSCTPTLSTFVQGEVELISGVRLVPFLGHTTDDCVVTFGSGAWQAMFLTDTIASCLSRQGDQAQSNHSLGSGPQRADGGPARTQSAIERCWWWSCLRRNAGRHTHWRSQRVAPPAPLRSRVSGRPSPIIPIPRMRCRKSSAAFTGTKLAADSWPTMSLYKNSTRRSRHRTPGVGTGLRYGARHSRAGDSEQQVHDVVQDRDLEQAGQLGVGMVAGER
jgi:hypothetical protein